MPKNINCFTITITLEGVKKIKSQKIQQNSLNEKIHFKPAKSLRFSPQSTPQLKAKSLPFCSRHDFFFFVSWKLFFFGLIFGGKEGWTVDHKGKNNQTVTADRMKLCKIPKTDWHISLRSSLAVCSKGSVEIG